MNFNTYWKWLIGAVLVLATASAYGAPAHSLTVGEGFVDPLGFHDATPVFSWKLPVGGNKQTAYRIESKAGETPWDSGWVESGQSTLVPYGGKPLDSRQRVEWRVNFRDENGKDSGWSNPAHFEMGLLSSKDWKAQWIRPNTESNPKTEPVAWLRRKFPVSGKVASTRIYVTVRGLFALQLNGDRVGKDYFANGWTSYTHRLDTLTYDVTKQLHEGENIIEATLGTGWYAGRIGWGKKIGIYGQHPELLLQLEITYEDGSSATIVSDGQWEGTFDGPVLSSSIYDGESYDAQGIVRLGPGRGNPRPRDCAADAEAVSAGSRYGNLGRSENHGTGTGPLCLRPRPEYGRLGKNQNTGAEGPNHYDPLCRNAEQERHALHRQLPVRQIHRHLYRCESGNH